MSRSRSLMEHDLFGKPVSTFRIMLVEFATIPVLQRITSCCAAPGYATSRARETAPLRLYPRQQAARRPLRRRGSHGSASTALGTVPGPGTRGSHSSTFPDQRCTADPGSSKTQRLRVYNDPGSAAHHYVLRCTRDTQVQMQCAAHFSLALSRKWPGIPRPFPFSDARRTRSLADHLPGILSSMPLTYQFMLRIWLGSRWSPPLHSTVLPS